MSLLDESLFRPSLTGRHQKITLACSLGLAVRNQGGLATFGRTIPVKAVLGVCSGNLVLIARV